MRPWQLTIASVTRHPLFPDEAARLHAVLAIVRVLGPWLVLFCVADDHIHVIVYCDDRRLGILSRSFKLCIHAMAAVPVKPVHIEPVHGRNHMENLHDYVLRQPSHHGLPGHQALWSGSCFPDLVGARSIPGLELRVLDVLARWRLQDACRAVDIAPGDLTPFSCGEIRAVGPVALVRACAAAFAAPPNLTGHQALCVRARRAACTLARQAKVPTKDIAWALGIHPGSARKCLCASISSSDLDTVRTRLALERAAARAVERERQRNATPNPPPHRSHHRS